MNCRRSAVLAAVILAFGVLRVYAGRETANLSAMGGMPGPVIRYEISVEFDPAGKTLKGREDLTWSNKSNGPVADMYLHLYWNAFRNEKSVFFRESGRDLLGALKGRPEEGEWGWMDITGLRTADGGDLLGSLEYVAPDGPDGLYDRTVARIVFPKPVPPGGSIRLELEFKSRIPRTVARSGYRGDSFFFGQWYPKPGVYEPGKGWNAHAYHYDSEFFADFADYVVHITLPERYVVGATGEETGTERLGASGRVIRTFVQSMVHDFAWTADPRFRKLERMFRADAEIRPDEYAQTASLLGLSAADIRLPDVKMILLLEPEHRAQAERHFRALAAGIKYYGLLYGPYPYKTITMVDPPYGNDCGGMEYPTLFTAGTHVLSPRRDLSLEEVVIHEFGHNYWYGLAANNEFEEAWLDEGINTYSTSKVVTGVFGPTEMPLRLNGVPPGLFFRLPSYTEADLNRFMAINATEIDPVTTASWKFMNSASYGANVYMRAALLLQTLELYLGEQTMARIMRTYQTRFRYRHPRTEDFIAVAREVSGRDLGWFFSELFMSANDFDYGIGSVTWDKKPRHPMGVFEDGGREEEMTPGTAARLEKKESGRTADVYLTTVVLRRFGTVRLGGDAAVEFQVRFEDGSIRSGRWDGRDRWARFEFTGPSRPAAVTVDPRGIWLIDSNLTNNTWQPVRMNRNMAGLMSRVVFAVQNLFLSAAGLI